MAGERGVGQGRSASVLAKRLLLYGLLILTGCSADGQDSVDAKDKMLRLGLPAHPAAALSIIAMEKGFFTQAGLNVVPLRFLDGTRSMHEGLFKGRVGVVTPPDAPVVIAAFERNDFVVLGTLFNTKDANRIVARRDRGIKQPSDLRGKRIGTPRGSAAHYFLYLYLTYYGLQEEDVDIVFLDAEELPNALADGKIDAFSMREPFVSHALNVLPDQAHAMAAPGIYKQLGLLVVRSDLLEYEPETVLRLLRGLKEAEGFVERYPSDSIMIVARYLGSPAEEIRALWPKLELKLSLDATVIDLLEQQAQWVNQAGLVKDAEMPNLQKFIKPEPLRSLWPERVQPRLPGSVLSANGLL